MTFGGETILVAEHDQIVLQVVCRVLARAGYRIVQARSAEDAVRAAARHENKIDLLLTETLLPTSRGSELAELLRLDYPDLQVVYISRLSGAGSVVHDRRSPVVVLQNAFRGDRLIRAVRDALEKQKNKAGLKVAARS
jgi:two-component system, cell cycle sensor histidine kinase and response regulator CckA